LQAKAKISLLQEQRQQMTDAIAMYDTAINTGDAYGVPDWSFNIEPEFRDPEIKRLTMVNGGGPDAVSLLSFQLALSRLEWIS